MRISAGVQLDPRDPRASSFFFFFLCVRRFLFSPQLSRIGYKGSHLITNKGNDIDFASHICSNVFFFFSFVARFIEQSIMWTSIFQGVMLLCLFFQFLRVPFIDAFLWYLLSLCIIEKQFFISKRKCVV